MGYTTIYREDIYFYHGKKKWAMCAVCYQELGSEGIERTRRMLSKGIDPKRGRLTQRYKSLIKERSFPKTHFKKRINFYLRNIERCRGICNECGEPFPLEERSLQGTQDLQPCFFVARLPEEGEGLLISVNQKIEEGDSGILNLVNTRYNYQMTQTEEVVATTFDLGDHFSLEQRTVTTPQDSEPSWIENPSFSPLEYCSTHLGDLERELSSGEDDTDGSSKNDSEEEILEKVGIGKEPRNSSSELLNDTRGDTFSARDKNEVYLSGHVEYVENQNYQDVEMSRDVGNHNVEEVIVRMEKWYPGGDKELLFDLVNEFCRANNLDPYTGEFLPSQPPKGLVYPEPIPTLINRILREFYKDTDSSYLNRENVSETTAEDYGESSNQSSPVTYLDMDTGIVNPIEKLKPTTNPLDMNIGSFDDLDIEYLARQAALLLNNLPEEQAVQVYRALQGHTIFEENQSNVITWA